jgi:hypothetical protein
MSFEFLTPTKLYVLNVLKICASVCQITGPNNTRFPTLVGAQRDLKLRRMARWLSVAAASD